MSRSHEIVLAKLVELMPSRMVYVQEKMAPFEQEMRGVNWAALDVYSASFASFGTNFGGWSAALSS